jgi:hypothetical protein
VHPRTTMCPTALNPASLLRRAPTLLCASWPRTPPPCSGGLRCRHVSHGSEPRLPAREGSGAAMCPTAPDPASLLRRALVLPRVARLLTSPSCSAGLWCCYVSHGSGPRLPAREGSSAATCPTALNPASLLGGGGSGPRLPAWEGSNAATCPWLWTLPPCSGGGGGALTLSHAPCPSEARGP